MNLYGFIVTLFFPVLIIKQTFILPYTLSKSWLFPIVLQRRSPCGGFTKILVCKVYSTLHKLHIVASETFFLCFGELQNEHLQDTKQIVQVGTGFISRTLRIS